MVDTKVLIGVTTQEYSRRADFYDYLNLLAKPSNTILAYSHNRSPAKGRNVLIEAAIANRCSHVLLVDDDMVPNREALYQLLDHDVSIVSGLYFNRAYPHIPLAFDVASDDGSALPIYLTDNMPRLTRIVAAGLGFVLIKTEVFSDLEKPWIRIGELDPEEWCDDMGFFHRVNQKGIPMWLDTQCCVGHMGTMIIRPNYVDGKWYAGYDTAGKGSVNISMEIPEPAEKT